MVGMLAVRREDIMSIKQALNFDIVTKVSDVLINLLKTILEVCIGI